MSYDMNRKFLEKFGRFSLSKQRQLLVKKKSLDDVLIELCLFVVNLFKISSLKKIKLSIYKEMQNFAFA